MSESLVLALAGIFVVAIIALVVLALKSGRRAEPDRFIGYAAYLWRDDGYIIDLIADADKGARDQIAALEKKLSDRIDAQDKSNADQFNTLRADLDRLKSRVDGHDVQFKSNAEDHAKLAGRIDALWFQLQENRIVSAIRSFDPKAAWITAVITYVLVALIGSFFIGPFNAFCFAAPFTTFVAACISGWVSADAADRRTAV